MSKRLSCVLEYWKVYSTKVPIKGQFMISAILLLLQGICGMSYGTSCLIRLRTKFKTFIDKKNLKDLQCRHSATMRSKVRQLSWNSLCNRSAQFSFSLSFAFILVLQIAVGTIFPSLLISGIIWPIEAMPAWVKVLTNISPITYTGIAMRDVACRGWGFTSFNVWFGFVVLLLWTGFFNLIAVVVLTVRR